MLRYFGCVWNVTDTSQTESALRFQRRIESDLRMTRVYDQPGLCVYCAGLRAGSLECYPLPSRGGVVIGKLFSRRTAETDGRFKAQLDDAEGSRIVATGGRHLIANYWGRYVAFIREQTGERAWVLEDPSAGILLYRAKTAGVYIYFSNLADYVQATAEAPTIDWQYLAAHAVLPVLHTERTALNEVREIQGGQCDEIASGSATTVSYWLPSTFALRRIEDAEQSALALRRTVRMCVHAWASTYGSILHQLSGGLDSSIVLGCLRDAPTTPTITALTHFRNGAGTDERPFARIAAQAAGCRHIEREINSAISFEAMRHIIPSPRPSMYLGCLHEREIVATARDVGANAIMTGNAGDAVFGEIHDVRVAVDYVHDHGLGPAFFKTIAATAQLTQIASGRVLWQAVGSLARRRDAINPLAEVLPYRRLLNLETVLDAISDANRFAHSWVREAQGVLPPGKLAHISMVSQPMPISSPLSEDDDPEYVHPLASQPIMELCFAMPTYLLTRSGTTRSVARAAFAADVERVLLQRRTKGNPRSVVHDLLNHNRAFIRERLLDGELVRHGVLERAKLEEVLGDAPTDIDPTELLFHISTEVWLERLRGMQQVASKP